MYKTREKFITWTCIPIKHSVIVANMYLHYSSYMYLQLI